MLQEQKNCWQNFLSLFQLTKTIIHMKNPVCLFIFLFQFIFISVFSQSSVWKIEGKGTEIYVGGSIHILRDKDFPLPEEFYEAYKNSEILVFETDINEAINPSNFQKVQKSMFYQDDTTLKNVLNEVTYNKLDSVCKQYELDLSSMNKLKFRVSSVILSITYQQLKKIGATSEGVDKHFMNKAENDKKGFLYLETYEKQLSFIEKMGVGNENEFVMYSIRDLQESNEKFVEMIEAWKTGDSKLMTEELSVFQNDYPEIYNTLVKERNDDWIIQLENLLQTPETKFVIVGALHLNGTDGVLQQMKAKGYKINQL